MQQNESIKFHIQIMIDTIKAQSYGRLREDWESKIGNEWRATYHSREEVVQDQDFQAAPVRTILFQHLESGLRFRANELGGVYDMECSLPKVLEGRNDHVIRSQTEVAKGWDYIDQMGDRFFERQNEYNITRMDCCWQVDRKPSEVLNLHRWTKHPQVKKSTTVYEGESVHFPGRDRHLRIYDKGKEQKTTPDQVTRVELQLRGAALRTDLGYEVGDTILEPDGEKAYHALRRFCWKIADTKFSTTGSLPEVLARAIHEDTRWQDGTSLWQTYAAKKNRSTVLRMQRKIKAVIELHGTFSWKDHLPKDHRQAVLPVIT